ncbi:MAG TPA: hypothetical protein VFQ42_22525 [Mycobacterium sp.]|nr:hypothetical protein [Mycobacterium sp.]
MTILELLVENCCTARATNERLRGGDEYAMRNEAQHEAYLHEYGQPGPGVSVDALLARLNYLCLEERRAIPAASQEAATTRAPIG